MSSDLLVLEGADLIDGSGGPAIRNSMVVLDGNCISYAGRQTTRVTKAGARYVGRFGARPSYPASSRRIPMRRSMRTCGPT